MIDVLIPCKGLSTGKSRLSPVLAPDARAWLCETLLRRTVAAALAFVGGAGRVAVVSPDRAALQLASSLGAIPLADPGQGLNASLAFANAALGRGSALVVLPIDLPRIEPSALASLVAADGEVVLAPDIAGTGTNALGLGRDVRQHFDFSFGPMSCPAHERIARDAGRSIRKVTDPRLGFDLDSPDDLLRLSASELTTYRCPGTEEHAHEAA